MPHAPATARVLAFSLLAASSVVLPASAEEAWRQPSKAVLDVLNAPENPLAWAPSPTGDILPLVTPVRRLPIADLARPKLRLAGVRIDPRTNGFHGQTFVTDLTLVRIADGRTQAVELPATSRLLDLAWSADGRRFALTTRSPDAIELWVGDAESGSARRVPDVRVNPMLGSAVSWMPDQHTLLVKRVPPDRGASPAPPDAPAGPFVQESAGGSARSTYEARDVLTSPQDEALFEYHGRSQLVLVDAATLAVTPLGEAGILGPVAASPDGRFVLVNKLHRPWSHAVASWRFPRDVEVWDRDGRVVRSVAQLPLADQVPIDGVPEGPRSIAWRQTAPATLVWVEALDGGDPRRKAAHRDRVLVQAAPFDAPPREVHLAAHRVEQWWWGERGGTFLVSESEWERRWKHVWLTDVDARAAKPRQVFDLSENERYADPGNPTMRQRPDGTWVLAMDGDSLLLSGAGASPKGDRPFLDRFSLSTLKAERLFRCDEQSYETFAGWLDARGRKFVTRRESPTDPPNYHVRTLTQRASGAAPGEAAWRTTERQLTTFADPTPQLRTITKRIVKYEREDGVPLSFTLWLPAGAREGERLPTVVWAYPLEYSDPATAGQVRGTDRQFARLDGASPLFFLLDGYAVLDNVTMPVVGDPLTAYDTFIEQLVSSSRAAIGEAVRLGVTDPDRVGVMGHSHGALMTATLLAHSDLFRAGIARSGAYNHTMRPFGFQNERRTLWTAPETYVRLSPVMHADKINEPLLLIHGAEDQNPGTVPLQSEKLFESIRGTHGTVRLVMLPAESHAYRSQEAIEDVLAEQLDWFDRWVKRAAPRGEQRAEVTRP